MRMELEEKNPDPKYGKNRFMLLFSPRSLFFFLQTGKEMETMTARDGWVWTSWVLCRSGVISSVGLFSKEFSSFMSENVGYISLVLFFYILQ